MPKPAPTSSEVVEAIRDTAKTLGHAPSRSEFRAATGITERQFLNHFANWREAVRAAGLKPHSANQKLEDGELLDDWGALIRKHRRIPTREQYRREGGYSPGVFEKHFGPWAALPEKFREYAKDKAEWIDVLALIPQPLPKWRTLPTSRTLADEQLTARANGGQSRYGKLPDRPTYGDPIDFRGLRHEPVNEQGVVFLFGMVAKELGYMVEAVQTGFPDCEAKRQVGPSNWQRVRIEFEFESRNFRDHGHVCAGCDVIVCWRHNWLDAPPDLEIVELSSLINMLSKSND